MTDSPAQPTKAPRKRQPKEPEFSSERMIKLSIELVRGGNPRPRSEAERRFLERLAADVAQIRAEGGVVELPFEWLEDDDDEED